jgi:hypothetical protein
MELSKNADMMPSSWFLFLLGGYVSQVLKKG